MKRQKLNPYKLSRIKTRYHKQLFTNDSPYGHKIQQDKSKQNPRKYKYKKLNIDMEED